MGSKGLGATEPLTHCQVCVGDSMAAISCRKCFSYISLVPTHNLPGPQCCHGIHLSCNCNQVSLLIVILEPSESEEWNKGHVSVLNELITCTVKSENHLALKMTLSGPSLGRHLVTGELS